ncbi:MAG: YhgE/Pip domain-containing protein [Eubacterium sp.]
MEKKIGKSFSLKKLLPWIIILGVIVIPLMYSFFYLDAFWDPYSRLNTLPVAIVNEDKGATINGSSRNLGKEMWNELKSDGTLKFVLTDSKEAKAGTEGDQYYAMIVIPENFSSNIASAADIHKHEAEITFSPNEKRNYLASQILNNAIARIEKSTRSSVNKELVGQLTGKLQEVPGQLGTLQDGLGQLNNGASQLTEGIGQLKTGTGTLVVGANALNTGSENLLNGTITLSNGTKDLSKGTNTLTEGSKTLANGTSTLSGGASDLASGIGEFSTKIVEYQQGEEKAKRGTDDLTAGIESLDTGLTQIADTLTAGQPVINAKLEDLVQGTSDLKEGTAAYQSGMTQYVANVNQLIDQMESVAGKTPDLERLRATGGVLDEKSSEIAMGAERLNAGAVEGVGTLNMTFQQIGNGIGQAKDGSSQLVVGSKTLQDGMNGLNTATGQLVAGASKLDTGAKQVNGGAKQVNGGAQSLYSGAAQVNTGASQVNAGVTSLNDGANQLNNGISTLDSGAKDLDTGANQLNEGSMQLKDGLETAKTGVDDNLTDVKNQLKPLDGLENYAANPVNINTKAIDSVPNYGTAFAPYFLSLSLWVGALIIFFGIYLDADEQFKLLSRKSDKKIIRSFFYLVIGLMQAVLLAVVLQFGLGLHINDIPAFYLSCCLVSMVFIAIVQFLMVFLKDMGKFLAIALLILQLTSCGGTFPMETVPKFFNILYPFMPMTYSVGLFKNAISGTGFSGIDFNSGVLIGILVIIMTFTILLSFLEERKETRNQLKTENLRR